MMQHIQRPVFKKNYSVDEKAEFKKNGYMSIEQIDVERIMVLQPTFKDITTDNGTIIKGATLPIMYNIADKNAQKPELIKFYTGMTGLRSSYGVGTMKQKVSVRIDLKQIYLDDDKVVDCHYVPILRAITEKIELLIKGPILAQSLGLMMSQRGGNSGFSANVKDLVIGSKTDPSDLRMYPSYWLRSIATGMRFFDSQGTPIPTLKMCGISFKGTFIIFFNNIFSSDKSTFRIRCHPSVTIVDEISDNEINVDNVYGFANKGRSREHVSANANKVQAFLENVEEGDADTGSDGKDGGVVGGNKVSGATPIKSTSEVLGGRMPQQFRAPSSQPQMLQAQSQDDRTLFGFAGQGFQQQPSMSMPTSGSRDNRNPPHSVGDAARATLLQNAALIVDGI